MKRTSWLTLTWIVVLACLAGAVDFCAADPPEAPPTDAAILAAMQRGAEFLLQHKQHNNWERNPAWQAATSPQPGGETALALWALLTMGRTVDDPRLACKSEQLAPAVDWMLHQAPDTVFSAAVKAKVLTLLPARIEYRRPLEQLQHALQQSQLTGGGFTFALAPGEPPASLPTPDVQPPVGPADTTSTAYGLFGIAAALEAQGSADWPPQTLWSTAEKWWRTSQHADGGWGASPADIESQPAASAAALAGLYQVHAANSPGAAKPDPALERGLAYLAGHFDPALFHGDGAYLYAILRVGQITGLRRLGSVDWYAAGAAALLADQQADGSWPGASSTAATAYALLFLAEGRTPLAFNQLTAGAADSTTAAAIGAGHLARALERTFEIPLGWRALTWNDPPAQFEAAPLLLVEPGPDFKLTAEQIATLRAFCQNGGLIFSTGQTAATMAAVGRYARQLGQDRCIFRKLPDDHPVFEIAGRSGSAGQLWGLSNGVREWWVHVPMDLDIDWQKTAAGTGEAWRIPANLLRYVTEGTGHLERPVTAAAATQPIVAQIDVARVRYTGNWDPEPAAWAHWAQGLPRLVQTAVRLDTCDVAALAACRAPLADLTGTDELTLTAEQEAALKTYTNQGGLLLLDAAGSRAAFAKSARALIARLYPDAPLAPLPLNSAIYNGSLKHSVRSDRVTFRRPITDESPTIRVPRLEGIMHGGRYVIIFSGDDLVSGLLGTQVWGMTGYAPVSARALVGNVLLYAAATHAPE